MDIFLFYFFSCVKAKVCREPIPLLLPSSSDQLRFSSHFWHFPALSPSTPSSLRPFSWLKTSYFSSPLCNGIVFLLKLLFIFFQNWFRFGTCFPTFFSCRFVSVCVWFFGYIGGVHRSGRCCSLTLVRPCTVPSPRWRSSAPCSLRRRHVETPICVDFIFCSKINKWIIFFMSISYYFMLPLYMLIVSDMNRVTHVAWLCSLSLANRMRSV